MIRPIKISDANRVYDISKNAFFKAKSVGQLVKDIEENSFLKSFVYEENGVILGYYISSMILDIAELFTIAVDQNYRKQKIGSYLLDHLINRCKDSDIKEIWLEVSTKNEAAINLYEKYGFTKDGLRKNYYQQLGEDAYNMKRKLK